MPSDRIVRINELMRQEIANVVQKDFEFSDALVTINAVEISPDLRDGCVYVGIIGSAIGQKKALELLEKGRVDIQAQVSKRVKLRLTPKLRFQQDTSAERATDILKVLDDLAAQDDSTETNSQSKQDSSGS